MSEYEFYLQSDFSQYVGKWIGIFENKIIVHGKSFKEVAETVDEKFPNKKVLITRIPQKMVHIL